MRDRSVPVGGTAFAGIARSIMSQRSQVLALSLSVLSLVAAPLAHAQWAGARGAQAALSLAPSYQDDYSYWRQQVRVASPQRRARWNAPPPGAVRVYQRRFDARWNSFVRLELLWREVRSGERTFETVQFRPTVQIRPGKVLSQVTFNGLFGDEVDFTHSRPAAVRGRLRDPCDAHHRRHPGPDRRGAEEGDQ